MVLRKNQIIYLVICILIIIGMLGVYLISKMQDSGSHRDTTLLDDETVKLEKYVKFHSGNVDSMLELAQRYFRINREYKKAEDLLSKVLEIDPKNEMAMHLQGLIMIERFQFSEAIEQYETKWEINKDNPVTLSYISELYFVSDRKKALEYAKKATMEERRLVQQGEDDVSLPSYELWEEMVEHFDDKFERDPAAACLEAIDKMIMVPLKLEICEYGLKSEYSSEPKNLNTLLEKTGLLYTEIDMSKEAIDTYIRLVETSPKYGMGYILLADRLIKENELGLINETHIYIDKQKDLTIEKNVISALLSHKDGKTKEAIAKLKKIDNNDYEIIIDHIVGMLYEKLGDRENAIEIYDKVLNDSSNKNPEYWSAIAFELKNAISSINS